MARKLQVLGKFPTNSGGGTGGGATPDWNAAEGEPGHILNRPFYSTFEEGTVLAECSPAFDEEGGTFYTVDPISLSIGKEYTVNWNGVPYKCIAQEFDDGEIVMPSLGDAGALEGTQTTGEPFFILAAPPDIAAVVGYTSLILAIDGSTSVTLSITGEVETITPVPEKYMPGLRGQKSAIINLDDLTVTGMTFAEASEMDVAELQSAISLFNTTYYETGITTTENYSIMSVKLDHQVFGELESTKIQIIYTVGNENAPPGYYLIMWGADGIDVHKQIGQSVDALAVSSTAKSVFYAKNPASSSPKWNEFSYLPIDGITMVSPSGNKFLVTIDDNGNFVTTADNT